MAIKRFQNKVAEGRYLLPSVALYTLGVWYLEGLVPQKLYVQIVCFSVATYLMVELNNNNALIRTYSRMVSSSFLLLSAMAAFLFPSLTVAIVQVCTVAFYTIIFRTYQDKLSPGLTFYAFFCLGIASVVFIQIVFFVPFLWLMMTFYLMAFSPKMLIASIIGIIAPYWFLAPAAALTDNLDKLVAHFFAIADFQPLFQYGEIKETQLIAFALTVLLALLGIVHFLRKSYMDKIRTRMLYYIFIAMDVILIAFIVLQPQHCDVLLTMLIINSSPLIAHFFTLTHTKTTNFLFMLFILALLLATAYNLWQTSPVL
ncbi:MAG: hypothetical protein PUH24_07840 [Prevotellaceae bacterium]|nr:hypothetical protein [Prevotella sp.]MDD7258160.1 hypothetical protein [Prevotellaceae bacterium]MDY6131003.1 hypothetical protein [Prevotella sp.]